MDSSTTIVALAIGLVIIVAVFFLLIQIIQWYVCYVAKINQRIKLMERQNYLLSRLAQKMGVDEKYLISELPELRTAYMDEMKNKKKKSV